MIGKQRRDVENGGSLMRKGSKRKKKGLFILRRKGAKLCIGFVLLYSLWVIGVYSRMKINNDARIKDEVKMMKSTNAKKKFIKNELPSFEELFGKDDDDADVNVLGFGTFSRRDENEKYEHGEVEDVIETERVELDGNERIRKSHRERRGEGEIGVENAPSDEMRERERVRESRRGVGDENHRWV
jgi:hypothetical protein